MKVSGGWRLTGQKLWTTNAQQSHQMVALVRTSGTAEDRQKGLSQFIIDLSLPGITIRPIADLTGDAHFSEVFFDDRRATRRRADRHRRRRLGAGDERARFRAQRPGAALARASFCSIPGSPGSVSLTWTKPPRNWRGTSRPTSPSCGRCPSQSRMRSHAARVPSSRERLSRTLAQARTVHNACDGIEYDGAFAAVHLENVARHAWVAHGAGQWRSRSPSGLSTFTTSALMSARI